MPVNVSSRPSSRPPLGNSSSENAPSRHAAAPTGKHAKNSSVGQRDDDDDDGGDDDGAANDDDDDDSLETVVRGGGGAPRKHSASKAARSTRVVVSGTRQHGNGNTATVHLNASRSASGNVVAATSIPATSSSSSSGGGGGGGSGSSTSATSLTSRIMAGSGGSSGPSGATVGAAGGGGGGGVAALAKRAGGPRRSLRASLGAAAGAAQHESSARDVVKLNVDSTSFEEWMKMATDNKINASNTWSFALIDYFHDMSLLRSDNGDGSINFQKASCTLDGCVKVWTSRVDSVVVETGKLLSGLQDDAAAAEAKRGRKGAGGEDDDDDGEGAAADEYDDEGNLIASADGGANGGGAGKGGKRKRNKAREATLVKSFHQIAVKKLDVEFSVDPLFRKTSADFDEGGAGGLLMNHLGVDGKGRIVFDASDVAGVAEAGNVGSGDDGEEASPAPGDVGQSAAPDSLDADEMIDADALRATLYGHDEAAFSDADSALQQLLADRTICPTFVSFRFAPDDDTPFGALAGEQHARDDASAAAAASRFGAHQDGVAGGMDDVEMPAFDDADDVGVAREGGGVGGSVLGDDDGGGGSVDFFDGGGARGGDEDEDDDPVDVAYFGGAAAGGEGAPDLEGGYGAVAPLGGLAPRAPVDVASAALAFHGVTTLGQDGGGGDGDGGGVGDDVEVGLEGNGGGAAAGNDVFDYFDERLRKNWAGPEHWKMRRGLAGFGQPSGLRKDEEAGKASTGGAAAGSSTRKPKEPFVIDFVSDEAGVSSKELFAPAKSAATISLPARRGRSNNAAEAQQQQRRETYVLPEDRHYSSRRLLRLFIKPRAVINLRRRGGARVAQLGVDNAQDDDDGRGAVEVDDQFWADAAAVREGSGPTDALDDGGGGAGFYDDDGGFDPLGLGGSGVVGAGGVGGGMLLDGGVARGDFDVDDEELASQALKRVRPEYVNYAKRAKKVDVRRLKQTIWQQLGIDVDDEGREERERQGSASEREDPSTPNGSRTSSQASSVASDASDASSPRSFGRVLAGLRRCYPKEKLEEISTSFCFICLLHLANEEGLEILRPNDDGLAGRGGREGTATPSKTTAGSAAWEEEMDRQGLGARQLHASRRAGAKGGDGDDSDYASDAGRDADDDDDDENAELQRGVAHLERLRVKKDPTAGRSA